MENIFKFLDTLFSMKVIGSLTLQQLLSTVFKYLFVFIVFVFIYLILDLIRSDLRKDIILKNQRKAVLKITGPQLGKKIRSVALKTYNSIGRDNKNDIVINDKFLSSRHCKIFLDEEDDWCIVDLNSSNGVLLNDEKLEPKKIYCLYENDVLKMGESTLRFETGAKDA